MNANELFEKLMSMGVKWESLTVEGQGTVDGKVVKVQLSITGEVEEVK